MRCRCAHKVALTDAGNLRLFGPDQGKVTNSAFVLIETFSSVSNKNIK